MEVHTPTKTTSTNDEALRNLDTQRNGGREGEVVLHVGIILLSSSELAFLLRSLIKRSPPPPPPASSSASASASGEGGAYFLWCLLFVLVLTFLN